MGKSKNTAETPTDNIIEQIRNNYVQQERALVAELFMRVNEHPLTAGTHREKVWKALFEQIVPKKFCIEQGVFLLDSKGRVSRETDLAIFDEQYTPYIFRNRNIKFIPIEAVSAVVQCKSKQYDRTNIEKWIKSIADLKPQNTGIAGSVYGTFITNENRKLRPLRILCGMFSESLDSIEKMMKNPQGAEDTCTDLIVCASSRDKGLTLHHRFDNLGELATSLANLKLEGIDDECAQSFKMNVADYYGNEKCALLSLMLHVNQCLMFINNPMLFPHRAYAKLFNGLDNTP